MRKTVLLATFVLALVTMNALIPLVRAWTKAYVC